MDSNENLNYDAMLMWPVSSCCNLNCQYCCVTENILKKDVAIPEINIPLFIKNLNNTKLTFAIIFSGQGEPFLVPNFIKACQQVTQNHYVIIVTNLTSAKIKEFGQKINPQRVISILASAHLEELEKKNLLNIYFENFLFLRNKGFTINAAAVAHPPLLKDVKRYQESFFKKGIELKFIPFRGEYQGRPYPFSHTSEEIKFFDISPEKYQQYKKVCNAGYNIAGVLPNGEIVSCFQIAEKIGNIYQKIKFKNKLIRCPKKWCGCPFNIYGQDLLFKALEKDQAGIRNGKLVLFFLNLFSLHFKDFKKITINKSNALAGRIGIMIKKFSPASYYRLKKLKSKIFKEQRDLIK